MWKKIEAIMKKKGITEAEIKEQLSNGEISTFNAIKYGTIKNPTWQFVSHLANLLDVSTDAIRPDDY